MKYLLSLILTVTILDAFSQGCCSGGGGNPITGSASTGVLGKNQIELQGSYQFSKSDRFLIGSKDTIPFFNYLKSDYLYLKADYGLTDKLTLSLGGGYYLNRVISEYAIGDKEERQVRSNGVGDVIFLPRYSVYNKIKKNGHQELSVGIGYKMAVGKNNDSTFTGYSYYLNTQSMPPKIDSFEVWQVSPPTVQTTTGSNDLILFAFYYRELKKQNMRFFSSATYMHRGWNSLGQKFGEYFIGGVYCEKTIFKKVGLMGQIRSEWVGQMRTVNGLDQLSLYNIDTSSTGSFKVSFVPQFRYTLPNSLTLFVNADIPIYQHVKGIQIASQHQVVVGASYRICRTTKKCDEPKDLSTNNNEELINAVNFKVWGKCDMCKERIETVALSFANVMNARWDVATNILIIETNDGSFPINELKIKLAEKGHDTVEYRSTKKAYQRLHECCKYERP